jgi:murein DD-endopeptidase MepM/ murein hydrolase activator NlpD
VLIGTETRSFSQGLWQLRALPFSGTIGFYDDNVSVSGFIVTNSESEKRRPVGPVAAARDGLGCLVIVALALIIGLVLLRNGSAPSVPVGLPIATITTVAPISTDNNLQQVLQNAIATDATLFPTIVPRVMPTSYVAPTLPPLGTPALVPPDQAYVPAVASPTREFPVTVTLPGPTSVPSPTALDVVNRNQNVSQGQWSLPPQQVPMSHDPRDHFYFRRPVDANANSTSLFYYPYGSAGPQLAWRVHHGLDMPNPDGQAVRAAADGVVVWASDHYRWVEDKRVVDAAESYGNVIIIAHNFGYRGAQLYTLYAHLSKILVAQNQTVTAGQVVGLSGHSGQVSGPHVHFEVREGDNLYFDTRNPLLWMAPLVGNGVVAGRVLYRDGSPVQNATISLVQNNRVVDTTYTYIDPNQPNSTHHQVDGDDQWHENFVIGDVPAGHYEVSVNVGGYRLIREVNVQDGTTAFADFGTSPAAPEYPPLTPIVPG